MVLIERERALLHTLVSFGKSVDSDFTRWSTTNMCIWPHVANPYGEETPLPFIRTY